ncbi:MAG TPA: TIGR04282 family arsenosugar biosynthesis glycosyltransferase [Gemmatimonadales bacterium]|nr:TIGR04282 family arsenosugar biosynthesis glycosyltransferase [Gemmatimonadales bacterium]
MTPVVAVLLTAPRPGAVRPRLAAEIGERQALRLYRVMAGRTLEAARQTGFEVTVWFAPASAGGEMRQWLGESWDLRAQASGDLGARLAAAEQAVPRGRGWLAIGPECPRLDAELLRVAAAVVGRGEVAVGPTEDGGLYLIGGTTPLPPVFDGVPWRTGAALEPVRTRLRAAGAAWRELPRLRDVSTAATARAEGLLT